MGDLFPSTPMGGDDAALPSLSLSLNAFPTPTPNATPSSALAPNLASSLSLHPNPHVAHSTPIGASVPLLPTLRVSGNAAPRDGKAAEFRVAVVVAEVYFNRMQWYPVVIKFTDDQARRFLALLCSCICFTRAVSR